MRAIIGRAAIAAIEKTARLTPMANPSPPSSSSMNRGRVETAIPTKTKNARVATVTMTKGALIKRARAESVTEAMMATTTPQTPSGFPDPTDVTAGAAHVHHRPIRRRRPARPGPSRGGRGPLALLPARPRLRGRDRDVGDDRRRHTRDPLRR